MASFKRKLGQQLAVMKRAGSRSDLMFAEAATLFD
jgi:hypothetical protein